MGKVFFIILIVIMVAGVAWVVLAFLPHDTGGTDLPDMKKATHTFYIENTGGLILASDFEQHGDTVGARLFALHGFWELEGQKFVYRDTDIVLNEAIFGEITVTRRSK